jgi:hypothetical protein
MTDETIRRRSLLEGSIYKKEVGRRGRLLCEKEQQFMCFFARASETKSVPWSQAIESTWIVPRSLGTVDHAVDNRGEREGGMNRAGWRN